MLNPDIEHIANCLSGVLSGDNAIRERAQQTLLELENKPGYAPCLIQLLGHRNELPLQVRLGGSLRLKELAKYSWWGSKEHVISDADRQLVCSELINMIVYENEHLVRAQLIEVLFQVLRASFPKEWPNAFDQINAILNNAQTPEVLLGATWCFNTICKVFRYASHDSDKKYMKTFVNACMPKLLYALQSTYKEHTPLALEFTKLVLKTFHYSVQVSTPPFYTFPVLDNCVALFLSIAQTPLDPNIEQLLKSSPNEASTNIHVKIRKWALKNLYTFLHKRKQDKISKDFLKRYGSSIATTIISIINLHKAGHIVPAKVWLPCFQILRAILLKANLYTSVVKPSMKDIIEIGVFNALCYTPKDIEDWTEDPYGFVAQALDPIASHTDHRYAAADFLTSASQSRHKTVLPIVLNLATNVFNAYQQNTDPSTKRSLILAKDTILRMFISIKKQLMDHNPQIVEQVILEHIFPEFKSLDTNQRDFPPVLAVRGLAFIAEFSGCQFKNTDILLETTKFACSCLNAADIALRVEAGQSLGRLLSHDSIREALKPNLGFLFQQILSLIKEISNETLAALLHDLVTYFDQDLLPYAEALVKEVVPLFIENSTQQVNEDDLEEAILSSMQYLASIVTIVSSVGTSEPLLHSLEQICDPIVKSVFETQELDYLDSVLQLFQCYTYFPKNISEYSWSYLPILVQAVTNWAPDYMEHFAGPLVNYFSNNIDNFYARPNAVQLILSVPQHFLSSTDLIVESAHAANVLRTLIGYSTNGQLNEVYPQLMELLFPVLFKKNDDKQRNHEHRSYEQLRLTCLDALCAMLHNNVELFFYLLNSRNCTEAFINTWFSLISSIKTERRAMGSIHALCKIFETFTIEQMPDCLRQQIPVVLGKLMEAMLQVKEAVEKEQSDDEQDSEPDLFDVPSDYDDDIPDSQLAIKEQETIEKIQKLTEKDLFHDDPDREEFGSNFEIYTTPIDDINPFNRFLNVFTVFRDRDSTQNKYTEFLSYITNPSSPGLALFTFAQEAAIRFEQEDSDEE